MKRKEKTNVDILDERGELEDIESRLLPYGRYEFTDDAERDKIHARINEMSALEIAKEWAAWNLGDGSWASSIISLYEAIKDRK